MLQDSQYLKFQQLYKGILFSEFELDYKLYRTVVRLLKSYYNNPAKKKLHLLYNKMIVLRRVFPEKFLYHELIISAPNLYTRSLIIYFLNTLFSTTYNYDLLDDIWEENLDELIDEKKIRQS